MAFVPGSGPISLSTFASQEVYNDTPPNSLSEFYRNGTAVTNSTSRSSVNSSTVNISSLPTSGAISFSDFRGTGYNFLPASNHALTIFGDQLGYHSISLDTETSFTVPTGITLMSGVCIGGGGGGGGATSSGISGGGGGGGGLSFSSFSVTPGETLTYKIGGGGAGGAGTAGQKGGDGNTTQIRRQNGTILIQATGGQGGTCTNATSQGARGGNTSTMGAGTGTTGAGGEGGISQSTGLGGCGGGSAGGYGGTGAYGSNGQAAPQDGQFGSGAGGVATFVTNSRISALAAGSGGGTNLFGRGANGHAENSMSQHAQVYGAGGYSNGTNGLMAYAGLFFSKRDHYYNYTTSSFNNASSSGHRVAEFRSVLGSVFHQGTASELGYYDESASQVHGPQSYAGNTGHQQILSPMRNVLLSFTQSFTDEAPITGLLSNALSRTVFGDIRSGSGSTNGYLQRGSCPGGGGGGHAGQNSSQQSGRQGQNGGHGGLRLVWGKTKFGISREYSSNVADTPNVRYNDGYV